MLKCNEVLGFTQQVFDDQKLAQKAAEIVSAILAAGSPRLSDVAQRMHGSLSRNYKALQRFLGEADPQAALQRLFRPEAPFVIGDPTEIARPQAAHTHYVGFLKDGRTRGFLILVLATPFRGRALPFSFVTYSSKTINEADHSRNLYHQQAFAAIQELLAGRPLVLDREFSYAELLESLVAEQVHFVIRLNLGGRQPPTLTDQNGRKLDLSLTPGQTKIHQRALYLGKIEVNLAGFWRKGFANPLWVMTNLPPNEGLAIYLQRMKIEESFRDLKSLLHVHKITRTCGGAGVSKTQTHLDQLLALVLLTYAIGLVVGEEVRDALYPALAPTSNVDPVTARWASVNRQRFSGLFILLKHKWELSAQRTRPILCSAATRFRTWLGLPIFVRTLV